MKRKSLILIAILTCFALTDLRGASAHRRLPSGTQTKTTDDALHFSIPDVEVYDQNGRQLKFNTDLNDHTPMILIGNDSANYWTRAYGLSPATKLAAMIKAAGEREAAKSQH
jgi:hypothetical protein